jgi:broad specificity phosphatase PhoE
MLRCLYNYDSIHLLKPRRNKMNKMPSTLEQKQPTIERQQQQSPAMTSDNDDSSLLTKALEPAQNDSIGGLHRRRTLYLLRHGEAAHNVLEAQAQEAAMVLARQQNLSPEETYRKMEEARKSVLTDPALRDAPLTERGRQQARQVSKKLQEMIDQGVVHPPTEAMCSPLSRCLETTQIVLENTTAIQSSNAHVRPELAERKTQFPPDTPKPLEDLLRWTRDSDRFIITHLEKLSKEKVAHEAMCRESNEMLRARASQMFDLLMELEHRHVLVVSHKGFLRELERGLLEIPDSPQFDNCEMRIYRVIFTTGDRSLFHLERLY